MKKKFCLILVFIFPGAIVAWAGLGDTLKPGSGFGGLTPTPPVVGSGLGSDATAIARWDVVPYQTIQGDFSVGVLAFHMNGIDRVDFSVNGGVWTSVSQMTSNPQTANHSSMGTPTDGIVEYWVTLPAANFPTDGPIEVRAIAYPKVGIPRVLDSLPLFTNNGGTLNGGTIYASQTGSDSGVGTLANPLGPLLDKALDTVPDGGTILLQNAGIYYVSGEAASRSSRTLSRFVTVKAQDGLAPADVHIQAKHVAGHPNQIIPRLSKIHWLGVRFDMDSGQYTGEIGGVVWFEKNYWTYNGWQNTTDFLTPIAWWSNPTRSFITDSYAYNGVYGTVADFVRNCVNEKISGAPFLSPNVLINSSVSNFNDGWIKELPSPPTNPYHRDIWHSWGAQTNSIAYGVTAVDQVTANPIRLDGGTLVSQDNAFVDWNVVTIPGQNGVFSNWGQPYVAVGSLVNHLLLKNFSAPNNRWSFLDTTPLTAHNFVIQDSGFHWATYDGLILHPENIPPGLTMVNQENYKASIEDWSPRNLVVTTTTLGIQLTWEDGKGTAFNTHNDTFVIRRTDDYGFHWRNLTGYLSPNDRVFTDTATVEGQAYRYVVQSINWPTGANEYSNVASYPPNSSPPLDWRNPPDIPTAPSSDLSTIRVTPNPWVGNKNGGMDITFDQLPEGATIKLYTIKGQLVKTLMPSGPAINWNLKNEQGEKVATGIYQFIITNDKGNKKRGKLAVIK